MNLNKQNYVDNFFKLLKVKADISEGHDYKSFLKGAIDMFLENENKDTANEVYKIFLDIYRIKTSKGTSVLDLLDALSQYEESMGVLNNKQRDHYIHSVNVFLLGLMIYAQNDKFRHLFAESLKRKHRKELFNTDEEFLFCWGMTALFHDIGYPVEMVNAQLQQFFSYVINEKVGMQEVRPYIAYKDFAALDMIKKRPDHESILADIAGVPDQVDPYRPTNLIAYNIAGMFGLSYEQTHIVMDSYLDIMQNKGFIDHGFYSALIVLRWYGEAVQYATSEMSDLFTQIVDAATAIFLHNAYKKTFQNPPFDLPGIDPAAAPISFLLILCDELQEWNRKAYGKVIRTCIQVDDISELYIDDACLNLHYIATEGYMNPEFIQGKKEGVQNTLQLDKIFSKGIFLSATDSSERYLNDIKIAQHQSTPRIMIEHLEEIAKEIHEDYCNKQVERKGADADITEWSQLTDSLKYSNIRQAMGIVHKLELIGCYLSEDGYPGDEIKEFETSTIEFLAQKEHDDWVEERRKNGWSYGEVKDVERKYSPYMIPYGQLTEDVKELDRDTIRNIIPIVNRRGLHVYKPYRINSFPGSKDENDSLYEELELKMNINTDYIETVIRNYIAYIQKVKEHGLNDSEKESICELYEKLIKLEEKGDFEWDVRYLYAEFLFEMKEIDKALQFASEYTSHAEEFDQEDNIEKGRALITKIYRSV